MLVAWGGHLHTYGTSLSLLGNGIPISTLIPAKNARQDVSPESVYIESFTFTPPVRVQKGDRLDLKTVYDKPRDLFYSGAMGIGHLIFDFESNAL